MKYETPVAPQPTSHYSLVGMMYGRQFKQEQDFWNALQAVDSTPQEYLAKHIEDFCDCV